jgi:hypothetical protein
MGKHHTDLINTEILKICENRRGNQVIDENTISGSYDRLVKKVFPVQQKSGRHTGKHWNTGDGIDKA